jgi:hypothetical protein
VETFTEPRPFVENPRYSREREDVLEQLDPRTLDAPIADLVARLNVLPFCFTLQSCYGHFISRPSQDDRSLEPVPGEGYRQVRYRIAYLAICLENSPAGRELHERLRQTAARDPEFVQFGSADWFWERHANSYALQVEPRRYARRDEALLDREEALQVQEHRDWLFQELTRLARTATEM